jgi:hypothetical protein
VRLSRPWRTAFDPAKSNASISFNQVAPDLAAAWLPPGIADRNTADRPSADAGRNAFVEAENGADRAINQCSVGRPAGLLIADEPIAVNGATAP